MLRLRAKAAAPHLEADVRDPVRRQAVFEPAHQGAESARNQAGVDSDARYLELAGVDSLLRLGEALASVRGIGTDLRAREERAQREPRFGGRSPLEQGQR